MLSKLMNSANSGASAHRQQFGGMQGHPQDLQSMQNRELLQRPEAVAILQGNDFFTSKNYVSSLKKQYMSLAQKGWRYF